MKNKSLLFFILLLLCNKILAQISVSGGVMHGYLREGLPDCHVSIINTTSNSVICSDNTKLQRSEIQQEGNTIISLDKKAPALFNMQCNLDSSSYIVTIEKKGYETWTYKLTDDDIRQKRKLDLGVIYLMPKMKEQVLDEVTIKATKIRMFYSGDTLVYNADAFNVSQLDKLRKLVSQLPGAEFKDGALKVNGKTIESLTVHGKDFFNGNIDAALDNLPAYIVSKLKVYDKAGEMSELTGRDMHDKSYMMDVKLKREYIGTWIAKLELNGGSRHLWGTQGMLMRLDDRQMFNVNFDANNINSKREMTEMGDMSDDYQSGRLTTHRTKFDYYYEPNEAWRLRFNGAAASDNYNKDQWTNTQIYMTPSDLITNSINTSQTKTTNIDLFSAIRFRQIKKQQHELSYSFHYGYERNCINAESSAKFVDSLSAAYQLIHPQYSCYRDITHNAALNSAFNIGSEVLKFNTELRKNTFNRWHYENYRLMRHTAVDEAQRKYGRMKEHAFNISSKLEYLWSIIDSKGKQMNLNTAAFFRHDNGSASHPLYRLDWMQNHEITDWSMASLGILPSGNWESVCIDNANSYYSDTRSDKAGVELKAVYKHTSSQRNTWEWKACLNGDFNERQLDYDRDACTYKINRHAFFLYPEVSLEWKKSKSDSCHWAHRMLLKYKGTPQMADLFKLLPIRDGSDPLNIFLGNENLKNAFINEAGINYYTDNSVTRHSIGGEVNWRHVNNDYAMKSVYESATGRRTYTPINTSKTHLLNGRIFYSFPIGKSQHFWLTTSLSENYYCREEVSYTNNINIEQGKMLHSLTITPLLRVNGTVGDKFRGSIAWQTDFQKISWSGEHHHYRTSKLSSDLTWQLPWNLEIGSDFKAFFYDGYSDASLNKSKSIWNCSLNKYFNLKGNILALKVTVHDILDNASSLTTSMSYAGRIEEYTNIMPRYVLLSINYMLNWSSKNK